jgi:hypothetical protein
MEDAMNLFTSLRARLNGQTKEQFGSGQRFPVDKRMAQVIRHHSSEFSGVDLSKYTFERRRSGYPDSKSDIIIYDEDAKPILNGREATNGRVSFWSS